MTGLTAAHLDVAVSSRLATSGYTAPDNASVSAIKAKTDNLPASPAAAGEYTSAIDALPTAAENAAAVVGDASTLTVTKFIGLK